MQAQKLSISLSQQYLLFVNDYQLQHHCKSRSDVIQEALRLLQQKQLMSDYQEANQEIDQAFEVTAGDGIDKDEAW
jgi:antitoxin ParD1/3/4